MIDLSCLTLIRQEIEKQIAVLTLCCDGTSFARVTWRGVGGDSGGGGTPRHAALPAAGTVFAPAGTPPGSFLVRI